MSRLLAAGALAVLTLGPIACTSAVQAATPACSATSRLALVAQSVAGASYVPCLDHLPQGWAATEFRARRGRTTFSMVSDRAKGRPVEVALSPSCDTSGASPATPRADGVRTSIRLQSVSPRYSGTLYDTFPGGCVSYRFDFDRGPHIALMEDLEGAVGLVSRRQLRLDLHHELGVELDP